MDNLRKDEDALLHQLVAHPGFKVLQKIADNFVVMNMNKASSENVEMPENRLLWLGEAAGMRKLLNLVVSRSESENATPSWTEHKGVPAWQTK